MSEFFLELFSEEIPARMQRDAAAHIERFMADVLEKNGLEFGKITSFAASRRIGAAIDGLPLSQADLTEERKGPSVAANEQALNGFLKSTGVKKQDLTVKETPKGRFYFATLSHKGRPTADVLKDAVSAMLASFPWPKSMRWAERKEHWVRPLHAVVCLFDGKVVPVEFAGVKSGDTTYGHRFLAPEAVTIANFADYQKKMRDAFVLVFPEERKKLILERARVLAKQEGYALLEDEGLLNEVAGLAEYPVCLTINRGAILPFLSVMQKYF